MSINSNDNLAGFLGIAQPAPYLAALLAVKGSCPRDVVRGPSPCVSPLKEFACPPIEEGIKVPRRSA